MHRAVTGTTAKAPAGRLRSTKQASRLRPEAGGAVGSCAVLRELSVQNLALLEDARVELERGYCVWTGETGAGKSLLLTALGLALGGKASPELIRTDAREARASAVFEIDDPALRAEVENILGLPVDGPRLVITRLVSSQGRGGARVNGNAVGLATLQKLGERLVDIHGQLDGRALLGPDRQRALLDAYGGLGSLLSGYRFARQAHEALRRKREQLVSSAQARLRERALLEFEHDLLAAADPRPGEYDELVRAARRLQYGEQVRTAAGAGYALLYENDHSAQDLLAKVARALEPVTKAAPEIAQALRALERLADETREVALTLRTIERNWEDDRERLEELETRMATYRQLTARFHCTPDELAERLAATKARQTALANDELDLHAIEEPLARAWDHLREAAARLTVARRKLAKEFARVIQERFKPLGLDGASLSVAVETLALDDDPTVQGPAESGVDRVEMLFSANCGEEPRRLRKVASGGELSRLTLAVKTVLAAVDGVPTLVFDEIDAGVGGRLGSAMGQALAELARHHQVICVTHLPQLANYADRHWVIRKRTERGRSRTIIRELDDAERIDELAAMLRGDSAAEGTRQEAMAMLQEARAHR